MFSEHAQGLHVGTKVGRTGGVLKSESSLKFHVLHEEVQLEISLNSGELSNPPTLENNEPSGLLDGVIHDTSMRFSPSYLKEKRKIENIETYRQ